MLRSDVEFAERSMLICQVTDLHMCRKGRLAYGAVDTNAMTDRALAVVAALDPRPDAVLVTGDLVESGEREEYLELLAMIRRHLAMPVHVVPGNHDGRRALQGALQDLLPLGMDAAFIQYVVDDLPVRIVMLDTLVTGQNHGELCPERLDFLERSLSGSPDRPTIVAMHHPPFVSGIGFMDRDNLRNADEFAAVIARHKQVERIICGHVHRPVLARVAHAPVWVGPSVSHQVALALAPDAPGAYVMDPPAFSLHRWTETDGLVSHLGFVGPSSGPYPFSGR